jgi:transposase
VRRAVGLLYVEGLTQEAAAQELGVHVNTIQNWQRKGFAKIKEQLALKGITSAPARGGGPRLTVLAGGRDEGGGGGRGRSRG